MVNIIPSFELSISVSQKCTRKPLANLNVIIFMMRMTSSLNLSMADAYNYEIYSLIFVMCYGWFEK